jgi:CheY-like chemotaxis protein
VTSRSPPRYVLVVEDDADVREAIAETLRFEGFAVAVACDGREALIHLVSGAGRPSLILLDLMMPGMNGWELLERMGGDPTLASIPVCIVSASGCAPPRGALDALHKPFQIQALLEVVARHLA